jgi:glycosyltransferase involved in cell wall biosynthesis
MRIILATDFYPPFLGGVELQVQSLSRNLVRRGHEVTVITVWRRGLPEAETDEGVHVRRLRGLLTTPPWMSTVPGRRYHPPFPDPAIALAVWRLNRRWHPDIVHSTGWISYSCAAGLVGSKTPLVVSARDASYSCSVRILMRAGKVCEGPGFRKCLACASRSYGWPKAIAAVLGLRLSGLLLRRKVAGTHSISSFIRQVLERDLWHGVSRLPSSVQRTIPDLFIAADDRNGNEARLDQGVTSRSSTTKHIVEHWEERLPGQPYILFVGGLASHKGLPQLLEAYQRLETPPPLVLIGTTWPDSPSTFPPAVTVLRNVPHEAVMLAWQRCLFGVAPSICAEALGDVVIEAMSAGKAVIASRIGGLVDLVVDHQTGLLVPPGDVNALAAAMGLLTAHADVRERMGQQAREQARRFTSEAIVPAFMDLYQEVSAAG